MQVAKNTVVTLDYSVTDPDGELVDAGQEPLVYLHGGYDDIFPMIEEAVHGKSIGQSVIVKMQPDDAFGEYDATLVQVEPRSQFPDELQLGMQFEGVAEGADDEDEDVLIYRVTEIADDQVVLDGNHPLAGMALVFTCTVTGIRPATADEIRHGHMHDDECDDDD
ncbi:peptidylprolyl isomerase [Accumulibacter sp.]|uniref:FKBP-type peptidyl-prolyl cis-trans isomerase n=1 Tax=Accumulibacter sp. TaxID=2053492 RepID=UPI0026279F15|nr:peptidylprolyl isomerase [Accumulibacter sp.]